MFIDTFAAGIEAARTDAQLVELSSAIWKGLQAGALSEDDAQRLAELIHVRKLAARASGSAAGGVPGRKGSPPRRAPQRAPVPSVAAERRRRLAYSGPLPPSLACRFTPGELAVLRIVSDEVRDRGTCTLPMDAIAARAGVCRELARRALRHAEREGLATITERRLTGWRNDTNVVRIISREWRAWIERGSKAKGGRSNERWNRGNEDLARGVKRPEGTRISSAVPQNERANAQEQERWRRAGGSQT